MSVVVVEVPFVEGRRTASSAAAFASGSFTTILTLTLRPDQELRVKGFGGFVGSIDGTAAIVAHRLRLRFSLDTTLDEIIGSPAGLSSEIFFPRTKIFKNTSSSDQTVTIAAAHDETTSQNAFVWLDEG